MTVWGGFPSNIGSHAEIIHCAVDTGGTWHRDVSSNQQHTYRSLTSLCEELENIILDIILNTYIYDIFQEIFSICQKENKKSEQNCHLLKKYFGLTTV